MKPFDNKKNTILIKSWHLHNVSQVAKLDQFRLYVEFDLDNYYNYNDFMTVVEDIKALGYNLSCVDFYVTAKENMFSSQELDNLKKFEKMLDENNATLFIKEHDVLWDISEIEKAYNYVDECVDKIKASNLSPLEQFLMAYKICCDHVYKAEDKDENALVSRSIYGVTNSDKIVCAGHANLLKEICNRLQNPDLKVYSCSFGLVDKKASENLGRHRLNLVELYDEKYNKSGIYHADSCWDSKNFEEDVMSLTYCLAPLGDVKYFLRTQLVPDLNEDLIYVYNDTKPTEMLSLNNAKALNFVKAQKLINESEARKKFAKTIIDNLELAGQTEKIKSMKDILSTTPFKSASIEYSFVRHITNKLINSTTPIEYQNYVDALAKICEQEGKNILQTQNYITKVTTKTIEANFNKFTYGAKNPFYTLANEKHKRIIELKEKRKAILQNRQNKTKIVE